MKITFIYFTFLFLTCNSLICQDYKSTLIEIGVNPNSSRLIVEDNKFIAASINAVNGNAGSSFLEISKDLLLLEKYDIEEYLISRDSPVRIDEKLFAYARENANNGKHFLLELNKNYEVSNAHLYTSKYSEALITSVTKVNNQIVGVVWDRYECETTCAELNFKLFNTNGDIANDFNLEENEKFLFTFEVDTTSAGHLITGGNRFDSSSFAFAMKLDLEGNILWKHVSNDKQSRGNVPVWTEELSNGNIVYTDKVDRPNNFQLELARRPTKLVWLSSNGDSLMHIVDEIPINDRQELTGLQKGKHGDYFFVLGDIQEGPNNTSYAFIKKLDNNGNIIWYRKYQHPNMEDEFHAFNDMIEMENGDIVTLGVSNFANIWMMRLDANGCFGDNDCGEINIYTNTKDIAPFKASKVSPNPTNDILNITVDKRRTLTKISLSEVSGRQLLQLPASTNISLQDLSNGVYIVTLHFDNNISEVHKIIKI